MSVDILGPTGLIAYAMTKIGTPYKWGGNNSLEGLDCSGFMLEVLRSQPGLIPKGDMSAQGLYKHFDLRLENEKKKVQGPGYLLFFGLDASKITHVGLSTTFNQMVEAGGGDSETLTLFDAEKRGAMVRLRPIRFDLVASFDLGKLTLPPLF